MNGSADLAALVLAAGEGTRMKSSLAKVLHTVAGTSMIKRVLSTVRSISPSLIIVVIGYQADAVRDELSGMEVEFAHQKERLGTGHAAMIAEPLLIGFEGTLVVLNGDTPLLKPETLDRFIRYHHDAGNAATVLSTILDEPAGYGRIVRDASDAFERIVEHGDATEAERVLGEINSGIFCFECPRLFRALKRLNRRNVQGEYYITDVMEVLKGDGERVGVCRSDQGEELLGINDYQQLADAERLLKKHG
jgi:bifunctional UDP-N-acetylglucosamine pyrophosphorylase/glucosamine-1-phosphate N-acetyltransferase